jgi:Protein of unknown function with PCYCGC motif
MGGTTNARWEQGRITRRAVLAVPLLAGLAAFGGCSRGGSETSTVPTPAIDAFVEMPEAIQHNYFAAVPNKALLQWIPCYCGCYATGHTSVYDCYVAEERGDGSIVIDTMSFG